MTPILSVQRGTNADLVDVARQLYPLDGRVLDMTHGIAGGFWKVYRPTDLTTISPTDQIDFRSTPWPNGTFDTVVYDPPYVALGGRSTSTLGEMGNRYGMTTTERTPALQWERVIVPGITEASRLLARHGRLWLKLQDYVTAGRVHWFTKLALPALEHDGFRLVDEFILDGRPGPQPPHARQVHARKAHSVLMIAAKQ